MKRKLLFSVIITSIYLIFSTGNVRATTNINLFQVTNDSSQQSSPLISGNLVAYDNLSDIWGYDLIIKQSFPILQKSGQQYLTGLHKNLLVYEDVDDTTQLSSIRLFNMTNNQDVLIASASATQSQADGVTNGKEVVYITGGACGSLNAYDLQSGTTTQIYDFTCTPLSISGNTVVFPVSNPAGTDAYGYDFNTKQVSPIAIGDGFQEVANIFGNKVVWLNRFSGTYGDDESIVIKNLQSGKTKILYETTTNVLNNPVVSNDYVVWSESTALNIGGVTGINLKTGEIFTVYPQGSEQNTTIRPAIWKNTAVWSSFRTGNGDIYGATFTQ